MTLKLSFLWPLIPKPTAKRDQPHQVDERDAEGDLAPLGSSPPRRACGSACSSTVFRCGGPVSTLIANATE